MSIVFEISTKNYLDDLLLIKKSLSHMETLVGGYNGYTLSEPSSQFGWTFFKLTFKQNLQQGIEEKFADMLSKYRFKNQSEKFTQFMTDYFQSKGCNVRIKVLD
ncbi:hypothetical protein [Nitrosarchaeum sp. AC2]|uniref:hypothetical protein n=1 Tax=Nitrosarchaeum sp. AC2 TaxID=2259673 RepID=UPI0015C8A3A0|nr:hypothetical protein [Nitrosarchaeum sp. AC2]QLH11487.1 hypothetical protein DSQ20_08585 [Nitrosarchaeum sp. AC2]